MLSWEKSKLRRGFEMYTHFAVHSHWNANSLASFRRCHIIKSSSNIFIFTIKWQNIRHAVKSVSIVIFSVSFSPFHRNVIRTFYIHRRSSLSHSFCVCFPVRTPYLPLHFEFMYALFASCGNVWVHWYTPVYAVCTTYPRTDAEKTTRVTNRKWDAREDVKVHSDTDTAEADSEQIGRERAQKTKERQQKEHPTVNFSIER